MEDIIVIKLTSGAEIVGRHASNPLHNKVILDDALNILMQPTEDGRVQIGLAPITLSIAPRVGMNGHRVELEPTDIMLDGPPVPAVAEAYRQATSRIEIASAVPPTRGPSTPNNVRPINRR